MLIMKVPIQFKSFPTLSTHDVEIALSTVIDDIAAKGIAAETYAECCMVFE